MCTPYAVYRVFEIFFFSFGVFTISTNIFVFICGYNKLAYGLWVQVHFRYTMLIDFDSCLIIAVKIILLKIRFS